MIVLWLFLNFSFIITILRAQDQPIYVEIGSTLSLQCQPRSTRPDIPTSYQWFNPNGLLMGEGNRNLVIPNFSYENQGVYTCKASQYIDGQVMSSSKALSVRVKTLPEGEAFKANVPSSYDSFANGIIFLQCKQSVGDSSNYKFEWIGPTGERQFTSTFFKNTAKFSDSGRYVCRVTRLSDNVEIEGQTFVNIQQLPIKIDTSGPLIVGSTLSMKCQIDTEKTNRKLFANFKYEWLDPLNRQISTDQLVNIPIRDTSNFGFYTCRITSDGPSPQYVQEQKIEVKSSGRVPNGGGGDGGGGESTTYTSSIISNPLVPRFYQPVELICQVQPSIAGATYRIMFNNRQISSNSAYVIPRLDKEHMGVYECFVEGRDVTSSQIVNLKSTYTIQPQFRSDLKIELATPPGPQITVRVGDKRELHCEIPLDSGMNGRDAVWYFDGKELSADQLSRYNIQILPRLYVSIAVLKNIQTNNQGRYECRIKGDTKEAYIIVMTRTKNIEVNPPEEGRKVGDGRPVEFHCRIDGYSTKNRDLIWTFMSSTTGQTTPLDNRWKRSDDLTADETSFILLEQAEPGDAGTYICTEPTTRDTARATLNVINDLRIVVTPPIIKLRVGGTATVQCYILNAGRSPGYPEFSLNGGRSSGSNFRMSTNRLEAGKVQLQFRSVTVNDNGTEFICRHGGAMAKSMLLVEQVCTAGFRLCLNGECINSAKFCDGNPDCSDGSDEDQRYCRTCDPLTKRCESFNGLQPTTALYQVHWSCDGEDDCGNGFDESRCFGSILTCGGLNYRCIDGSKTIPKAFMCDRDKDCPNGDDEDRCMPPTLIPEPSSSYQASVKRGETLTLTCQAAGSPLPKIIWRYNWGCLTDESRMIVTDSYRDCSTTVSILRISNFQPGDDGIYNCEALFGSKRAWSQDYQVLMDFKS